MCFITERSRIKKSIVPIPRYREPSYGRSSFLTRAKSRSERQEEVYRRTGIFAVCANQTDVRESRLQRSHLDEKEKEDALGRGCVPRANKSAEYTDGTVCTKPVLSVVSLTVDRRRKHARLVGKRAVLKREIAIYGADLFARSLREQKPGPFQRGKSLRHALDGSPRVIARGKWERGRREVERSPRKSTFRIESINHESLSNELRHLTL